jgi:hypothetical protein
MHPFVILAALSTLPPIPAALDFPDEILAAHNEERALAGTPPLKWDAGLAAHARRWALHLSALGELKHDPRGGVGENLSMGPAGKSSVRDFVDDWIGEKKIWRNGRFPDAVEETARQTGADWHQIGHYSQMIWRTTTHLGCAMVTAKDWDYLVCRYSPPGNRRGEKAY